jgi:hypothetical protein
MVKIDDWVEVKSTGNIGVVSQVDELVTVRIPQKDWPFPRYVTVPRKDVRKHRAAKPEHERALL